MSFLLNLTAEHSTSTVFVSNWSGRGVRWVFMRSSDVFNCSRVTTENGTRFDVEFVFLCPTQSPVGNVVCKSCFTSRQFEQLRRECERGKKRKALKEKWNNGTISSVFVSILCDFLFLLLRSPQKRLLFHFCSWEFIVTPVVVGEIWNHRLTESRWHFLSVVFDRRQYQNRCRNIWIYPPTLSWTLVGRLLMSMAFRFDGNYMNRKWCFCCRCKNIPLEFQKKKLLGKQRTRRCRSCTIGRRCICTSCHNQLNFVMNSINRLQTKEHRKKPREWRRRYNHISRKSSLAFFSFISACLSHCKVQNERTTRKQYSLLSLSSRNRYLIFNKSCEVTNVTENTETLNRWHISISDRSHFDTRRWNVQRALIKWVLKSTNERRKHKSRNWKLKKQKNEERNEFHNLAAARVEFHFNDRRWDRLLQIKTEQRFACTKNRIFDVFLAPYFFFFLAEENWKWMCAISRQ